MNTDWRKWWPFLAGFGSILFSLIGRAADLAQLLALKRSAWVLAAIFVIALVCQLGVSTYRHWTHYRTLKAKLRQVHDFILGSMGEQSTAIFYCATARWLRQHGQTICISGLQSENIVTLDMNPIPLKPENNLYGVWFSIIGTDGREISKGQVKLYTLEQACIELHELQEAPRVGDLAIPIEPPDATELERLLGNVLFIVSE